TQGIVRILEAFGWDIPLDELVTNLYGLSFASLDYANQKEVMAFISARIEKMIGSKVPKDIREAVLESDTYIVSLILEASQA
nr:glycine--tRNA ligase subunit beta [Streptococcus anginosus]